MGVFTKEFCSKKPVFGMVHFLPLPGSPLYDKEAGINGIRKAAMRDAEILSKAGYDGFVFSNEGDRPYLGDVGKYTVAVMARLINEIAPKFGLPFGVSVLADPEGALSVAGAVQADFVRTFLSWVFVADWGIADPDAGKLQRLRSSIDCRSEVLANISGHTEPLGGRRIKDIARGAVMFGLADAVCLAGTTAGSEIPEADLVEAREGSNGAPVFVGTGVDVSNLDRMMRLGDGVIVGSSLKVDGIVFNPICPERANTFIRKVREIRG
jgi:membrane complex biogenesis BtpA family protein